MGDGWHAGGYPVTPEFLRKKRQGHLLGMRGTQLKEGTRGEWNGLEQLLWGMWFKEPV